jgi:methyl-accepting chemotaxis protein
MLGLLSQSRFEAEAKLAALNKAQAVIEFNLDGSIITANENFLRTVGYTLADIQGKHHSMFVEPAFRETAAYAEFWRRLKKLWDGGEVRHHRRVNNLMDKSHGAHR